MPDGANDRSHEYSVSDWKAELAFQDILNNVPELASSPRFRYLRQKFKERQDEDERVPRPSASNMRTPGDFAFIRTRRTGSSDLFIECVTPYGGNRRDETDLDVISGCESQMAETEPLSNDKGAQATAATDGNQRPVPPRTLLRRLGTTDVDGSLFAIAARTAELRLRCSVVRMVIDNISGGQHTLRPYSDIHLAAGLRGSVDALRCISERELEALRGWKRRMV